MATYIPKGVCSKKINLDIKDGKIENIEIIGGCDGNLKGICSLLKGADALETAKRLENIKCGFKSTSCPDQISKAILQQLEK